MHILGMVGETLGTIIILFILTFLYFLPAIIAERRDHKKRRLILALNFVFGWSLIGWIGCLIWSLKR